MRRLGDFLSRIHVKLGDLWWYTILLFVAQRFGDVINMFVGLWIVPKYVPMEELGAVLPLTNVVNLIGVPLTIVAIPFLKFVAVFAEKREFGKVKALIRDTFVGTGVFALLSIAVACFILPLFFERLRVENGSLAFMLVVVTVLTAFSNVSMNAVGALKRFSSVVWLNAVAAPLRLLLVIILMPVRALTGYVAGGAANPIVNIIGPFVVLRRFFRSNIKSEGYWHEYGRTILMYTWPLVLMTVVSAVTGNMDTLVIRHRLCDFESAGYYMITRFADVSMQIGSAFVALLLPMLAGRDGRDNRFRKIVLQSSSCILVVGMAVSTLLWLWGGPLLMLKGEWSGYVSLTPEMAGFAFSNTLGMACTCITTAFVARSVFSFLWYSLAIGAIKSVLLYAVTGYTFFEGMLPACWLSAVADFNPCRLSVIMWTMLVANAVTLVFLLVQALAPHRPD